jgi:hypothetical protein
MVDQSNVSMVAKPPDALARSSSVVFGIHGDMVPGRRDARAVRIGPSESCALIV